MRRKIATETVDIFIYHILLIIMFPLDDVSHFCTFVKCIKLIFIMILQFYIFFVDDNCNKH